MLIVFLIQHQKDQIEDKRLTRRMLNGIIKLRQTVIM